MNLYSQIVFTTAFSGRPLGTGSLVRLKPDTSTPFFMIDAIITKDTAFDHAVEECQYGVFKTQDGIVKPLLDMNRMQTYQIFYGQVEENISGHTSLCYFQGLFEAETDEDAKLYFILEK